MVTSFRHLPKFCHRVKIQERGLSVPGDGQLRLRLAMLGQRFHRLPVLALHYLLNSRVLSSVFYLDHMFRKSSPYAINAA